MLKKYTLEEILEIFLSHAKEVSERGDEFNLPAAFVCMIEEILALKKKDFD